MIARHPLESFRDRPPRQKPAAFNRDNVVDQVLDASGGGLH